MSTGFSQLPALPVNETVFRLLVAQYHAMIETGVLSEDDPVELLEGVLVQKTRKTPSHRVALAKLSRAVEARLPAGWSIQTQEPITLSDGEPEPDLAVIRGAAQDYLSRHPGADDVCLVIEVSDATLPRDRTIKLRSYARAGIGQYWIINLVEKCVETYQSPQVSGNEPSYNVQKIFRAGESVPLTIPGRAESSIAVSELLP